MTDIGPNAGRVSDPPPNPPAPPPNPPAPPHNPPAPPPNPPAPSPFPFQQTDPGQALAYLRSQGVDLVYK